MTCNKMRILSSFIPRLPRPRLPNSGHKKVLNGPLIFRNGEGCKDTAMESIWKTYELEHWSEFWPTIEEIRRTYAESIVEGGNSQKFEHTEQMLYRGHSNADWPLLTTLERRSDETFSIASYLQSATRYAEEIEAFTGKHWDGTSYNQVCDDLDHFDSLDPCLPCYDYLVYLRHFGFPSPLLDWTRSPFIAAFFAFADPFPGDRVAIYVFIETPDGSRDLTGGQPRIKNLGPFTRTHARHFSQQAQYTIATKAEGRQHFFCPHEQAFTADHSAVVDQDVLVKITLPKSERWEALSYLEEHNLNHFTLFQDERALIDAMSVREFDVRRPGFNRFRSTSNLSLPKPREREY